MQYQIISDGSCDLPQEMTKEKNIHVVPFYVSFDDTNYVREMADISVRDFYNQMVEKEGVYPKSSMPSIQDYYDAFEQYAKEDIPVICICITEIYECFNIKLRHLEFITEWRELFKNSNPSICII